MTEYIIQGDNIDKFRLHTLKAALKLETVGLKKRGRSAYAIIKEELGFKGSREKVLAKLEKHLEELE